MAQKAGQSALEILKTALGQNSSLVLLTAGRNDTVVITNIIYYHYCTNHT